MSTEPTNTENLDRIWHAAAAIRTAMLVTHDGNGLASRPMSAIVRGGEATIWFLTDADSGKIAAIESNPEVAVTFCDGSSTHIAFRGTASIHTDRATIDDLWSQAAQAYYPAGPSDPLVRAVRFRPEHAEMWDGPGQLVAMAKIAVAIATGKSVRDMGDHVEGAV